jgi:hypothetical protein
LAAPVATHVGTVERIELVTLVSVLKHSALGHAGIGDTEAYIHALAVPNAVRALFSLGAIHIPTHAAFIEACAHEAPIIRKAQEKIRILKANRDVLRRDDPRAVREVAATSTVPANASATNASRTTVPANASHASRTGVATTTSRALAITAPHDAQRQGQNQSDEETHEDLPVSVTWGRRAVSVHT